MEQRHVAGEVRDFQRGQAVLAGAEKIPRAAQPQVLVCNAEAVVRAPHDLQPGDGLFDGGLKLFFGKRFGKIVLQNGEFGGFLAREVKAVGGRELLDRVLTLFGLLLDDPGQFVVGDGPHKLHLKILGRSLQKAQHAEAQGILGFVGGDVVLLNTRCQRHGDSRG